MALFDQLVDVVNDIQVDALEPGGSYIEVEEWAKRIETLFYSLCDGSGDCPFTMHFPGCFSLGYR